MACSGYCGCCKGTTIFSQGIDAFTVSPPLRLFQSLSGTEPTVSNRMRYGGYVALFLPHVKINSGTAIFFGLLARAGSIQSLRNAALVAS
jgi:hypothetical protein